MSTLLLRVLIPLCAVSTMSTPATMWLLRVLMPSHDIITMSSTPCTPTTHTLQVLFSERCNTSSSLNIFVLENSTFFMPSPGIRKKKLSTSHHSQLADSIAKHEMLAMWACGHCLTSGTECKVSENCDKCDTCIRLSVSYNLSISPEKINKVSEKILQLEKEKNAVTAQKWEMKTSLVSFTVKKERLHKQITFLKKCQSELIHTELQNIKELKAEEQTAAAAADSSNRPSLNFLTSEAFSLDDMNWLSADFFAGTDAVSLHNE